ncbi:ABC transporter substrate-binding protein [Sphingomonas crocodyli]|uniref:ABC transporter substrate-binding protein n=1 Tax=Sphingomonas crocodyli TaxID=1979270 RepID=A0A437LZZ4_9SPHN|nr:ABC transporter substrate-binding protein [Sphingomonas crocodyli]RVT91009.1 ABC transporter substrate-binding protein [Sphingomonas crocodyli]
MRGAIIAALAIAALASPLHAATPPKRIVSLNLCADQLILTLADRSQIAGLTRNAAKTNMSAEAARTKGLRILGTSAEQILEIDPDLVVGIPARRNAILQALKMRKYPAVDLKSADTLEDIYASIRTVSDAVGHADRGEAMIARMEADLARMPKLGRGRVAVYYQRRGYVTGTGTLVDDLMQRVGLVNLAQKLGKSTLSQMSLEEMVAARPDFLIVESATDKVTDQGTEMLHHPALDSIPRLHIPEAWTVCGGPAYTKAVHTLTEQLKRYR